MAGARGRRRGPPGNPGAGDGGWRAEWPPVSGANDPYDPKQVAALSPEALDDAVEAARKAFAGAGDLEALAAVRPAHLGDRAPVLLARRELGALPPAARPTPASGSTRPGRR